MKTTGETLVDLMLSTENTILDSTGNSRNAGFKCKNITHSKLNSQGEFQYSQCCLVRSRHPRNDNHMTGNITVKCLPKFIIAGTQKSGTTVLSAFLSSHPLIKFPAVKESHYFDRKVFTDSIEAYFRSFSPLTMTEVMKRDPPYFGEATPFYIASRTACYHIGKMLPSVKIIVLLREPVSRAYSEYQMKKRRVEQQNSFLDLVMEHSNKIYDCLVNPFYPTWESMENNCFPTNMTSHYHYLKFRMKFPSQENNSSFHEPKHHGHISADNIVNEALLKSITKPYNANGSINKFSRSWMSVVTRCFATSPEKSTKLNPSNDQESWDRRHHIQIQNHKKFSSNNRNNINFKNMKRRSHSKPRVWKPNRRLRGGSLHENNHHLSYFNNSYDDSDSDMSWERNNHTECNINYSDSQDYYDYNYDDDGGGDDDRVEMKKLEQWKLHHFATDSKYINLHQDYSYSDRNRKLLEIPKNITDVAKGLPRYFQPVSCMISSAREKISSLEQAFVNETKDFQSCISHNSIESVEQLDMDIDKCVKVSGGISRQYFYRSLYAVQLYNCFKYIPREQFYITTKEELEENPNEVVSNILKFIGIEVIDTVDASLEAIKASVEKHFPRFEKATGWRLRSKHDAIPLELEKYLKEFFVPYNKMLDRFLGRNISDIWAKLG